MCEVVISLLTTPLNGLIDVVEDELRDLIKFEAIENPLLAPIIAIEMMMVYFWKSRF